MKKFSKIVKFFPAIILVVSILMAIGYAAFNSVSIGVNGNFFAREFDGIFITDVEYKSDVNANVLDSKYITAYQTNLSSKVSLSTTDKNSTITYEVTIYNSDHFDYGFEGVEYDLGEDTYSNENITFELSGLNVDETITSGSTKKFLITFKYTGDDISKNELVSIINFKFYIKTFEVATYEYTGNYETFVAPYSGIYRIELWGASGGDDKSYRITAEDNTGTMTQRAADFIGGYGGYTSGEIFLDEGTTLYFYVGEQGKRNLTATWNGGGKGAIGGIGYNGTRPEGDSALNGFSGGGATDVRVVSGSWNDFDSLKSRIMVAGGGGGTTVSAYTSGGNFSYAGGLIGYDGGYYSNHTFVGQNGQPGTQTSGGEAATIHFNAGGVTTSGSFGVGGYTTSPSSQTGAGGGGGGYYGGSGASGTWAGGSGQGGGGGSSFISGHNGCNAVLENSTSSNIKHSGNSEHYSGFIFDNTLIIDGAGYSWTATKGNQKTMPNPKNELTTSGNLGDGYARVTYISELENYIKPTIETTTTYLIYDRNQKVPVVLNNPNDFVIKVDVSLGQNDLINDYVIPANSSNNIILVNVSSVYDELVVGRDNSLNLRVVSPFREIYSSVTLFRKEQPVVEIINVEKYVNDSLVSTGINNTKNVLVVNDTLTSDNSDVTYKVTFKNNALDDVYKLRNFIEYADSNSSGNFTSNINISDGILIKPQEEITIDISYKYDSSGNNSYSEILYFDFRWNYTFGAVTDHLITISATGVNSSTLFGDFGNVKSDTVMGSSHCDYETCYSGNNGKFVYDSDGGLILDEDNAVGILNIDQSMSVEDSYSVYTTIKANTNQMGADGINSATLVAISETNTNYLCWIGIYKNYLHVYSYRVGSSLKYIEKNYEEVGFASIDISKYSNKVINLQVTGVREGKTNVYINGELLKSFSSGSDVISYTYATIGDLRPGRNLKFIGTIYDFGIYNKALSTDEVNTNWLYSEHMWKIVN